MTVRDRIAVDLAKHYPGGKDHDQMNHGNRGGGNGGIPDGTVREIMGDLLNWEPLDRRKDYSDQIYKHIIASRRNEDGEFDSRPAYQKNMNVQGITDRIMDDPDVIDYATAVYSVKGGRATHGDINPHHASERYTTADITSTKDEWRRQHVENYVSSVIEKWAEMDRYQIEAINRAVAEEFGMPMHSYHRYNEISEEVMESIYGASSRNSDVHTENYGGQVNNIDPSIGRYAYRSLVRGVYEYTQDEINGRKAMHGLPKGNVVLFRGLGGRVNSKWLDDRLDGWVNRYEEDWKWARSVAGEYAREGEFPGLVYGDVEMKGRPVASWSASYSTARGDFAGSGITLATSVPTEAIFSTAETGFGALFEDEVLLLDHGSNVVTAFPAEQTEMAFKNVRSYANDIMYADTNKFNQAKFPSSSNPKKEKIAWTEAILSEYRRNGIWADTAAAPHPGDERSRMGRVVGYFDDDDWRKVKANSGLTEEDFVEEMLA